MEKVVIVLLALNVVVGLLLLLLSYLWYRQLKDSGQHRKDVPVEQPSARTKTILQAAAKPLSPTEKKYLQLFVEGKSTEEISEIMHVEPSSVYTMKYRIRKKFPSDYILPF